MDISGAAASGAWGIGVGSAWQASAAMASGIQRVLMVNQLVGKANMQVVAQLKAHYRAVDFICCVDSEVNVRALSTFFADRGQTLDVLIELGVHGGRCGCRSVNDALALAQQVSDLPGLRLRGLELYEGVLHGDDPQPQVEALLQQAAALSCRMEPLVDGEFILTGAGTVWYDVVCNIWLAAANRAAAVSSSAPLLYHPRSRDLRSRPTSADRPRSDCLRSRRRSHFSAGADGDGAIGAGGGSRGSEFRQARLRFRRRAAAADRPLS